MQIKLSCFVTSNICVLSMVVLSKLLPRAIRIWSYQYNFACRVHPDAHRPGQPPAANAARQKRPLLAQAARC